MRGNKVLLFSIEMADQVAAVVKVPETAAEAAPQAAPQVAPQAAPQAAPQVAPQAAPQVAPQAAPQAVPQAVKLAEAEVAAAAAADSAQEHAASAEAAIKEAAKASPAAAQPILAIADKEAAAATTDAATAKKKAAEAVTLSPGPVKAEFKAQSPVETLPVSAFNLIRIPANGWNLYNSILVANHIEVSGRIPDLYKELPSFNTQAQTLSKQITQSLEESDKNFFATMMTQYRIPDNATNDMLKVKLSEIDADSSLDTSLKDNIKQSLRFQYQKNSAVYQNDREGTLIDTPNKYITLLSTPLDANDLSKGPKASPDIAYLTPKIANAVKVSVYIFRPSSSQPDVYKLVSASKVDSAPDVKILHVNRNDISILSEKVRTDAKAMGLGKVAKAITSAKDKTLKQITEDIEVPPEIKFKDHIVVGAEKVVLNDNDDEILNTETGTNFLGMVSFKHKYFPGEDDKTLEVARFVFNLFFNEIAREDPAPPCSNEDYEVLLRGLTNRRNTLYEEIERQRGRDDDTLELRSLIIKFQTLEALIKSLEWQVINGTCQDYDKDGAPGGFSRISSQQEDEIRSLLRQFAFIVLQAKNPVAQYSDRTEEAKGIVEELRNDPVNANTMDKYLETWNEQAKKAGSSMPRILMEVLDRTDTQTGIIDKMAQDQIDELLKEIIGIGRQSFTHDTVGQQGGGTGQTQLQDFETIISQIEQEQNVPKDKALRIVRWIIDNTRSQWENLTQLKDKEGNLASDVEGKAKEIEVLTAKIAEVEKAVADTEKRLKEKTIEAADLKGNVAGKDAKVKEEEAKIRAERDDLALQIATLQTQLEAKTKDYDTIIGELKALRTSCAAGEANAADSAASVEKLNEQLAAVQQQLALMTKENTQLKESQAQLQAQISTQTATITKLQTDEAAATAAAAAATSKLAGLEGQVAELVKNSKGSAESEAAAKAQITQFTAQIQGLESEIKTLQSGKSDNAKTAAESAAKIADLTKESESLQGQVKTLEAGVATAAVAAAADAAKIKETQGLLDAATAEVIATTKDKDATAAQLAAAITQQGALQKKIDDLYTQWAEKNQELTNVKAAAIDDMKQATIAKEKLKGSLIVAEQKVNEQLQMIAARDDSLTQMSKAIKDLEAKIVSSANEIAILQKRVAEDTANYEKLDATAKAAAEEAKAQLAALTAQNAAIMAQLEKQKLEYDTKIIALNETIASQTTEITKLKDDLATTTAKLVTAQTESEKLTTQLSALQRTYNEDIKKLGDSLRAKQLEMQTKVTDLTTQLNQGKQQLVDAQNKLSELQAQFDAQKVIADQVPTLQADLEKQKGLAEQLPALQKELDEQHSKLDNMPTDSVVAAAAVAAAETDLASLTQEQIKLKYPTFFKGAIQKKGDTLGGFNTRDAAMVAAATRVWYIQFESKDYKNRMVISIQGAPKPTKNAGEFTMDTRVKGQPTTYTFKEMKGGPTREQWIEKYTQFEKKASAKAQSGEAHEMNTVLSELQNFAKSIVGQKEYAIPAGLTPAAGDAFMQIFNSIKKLKADAAPSSSNQACFLSYFIVFFFKALFFTKEDTPRRQAILKRLDAITDDVVKTLKTGSVFPDKIEDKNIIFKIMEVIFGLIDASETLFINKETRSGNPAQGVDIGLSVIKTKEDAIAKKILEVVYDKVSKSAKDDKGFIDDMNFVENALVNGMLISQPKIFFNKPLPIKAPADATQDAKDLLTYPNMTFMPRGVADIQQKDIKTRFQIIDVAAGFKRRQLMVKGIGGTPTQWQDALSFTMQDSTLQYSTLFATFVVFGRKYLVAAKDDFIKYSCKVPALIENPASMLTSMSAETPGTATCIDTETIIDKKDVDGQPLTKRFRASFKTPIQDATNLEYAWDYTSADGNPIKQVARLLFTPEEEKTLQDEEWYRGESQAKGDTAEVAKHSSMIADLWKRAEGRALKGKSNPGFSLTSSGQLASITFPGPGTYTVSCTIKYKRQGIDCVSKSGTQKIAQQGGGLDVVVKAAAVAAVTPSCDVTVTINPPTVNGLNVSFSTSLTGTLDGMGGQKYKWTYTPETGKKIEVAIPGDSGTVTYDFPEADTYKIKCDMEYSKKGISAPCRATQASTKVILSSASPSATPSAKIDMPAVTELVSVKGSANNAIAAAKKAVADFKSEKAAGKTTIKQNALSLSAANFKASLLARGLSGKSLTP